MERGTVKFYDEAKHFGFIAQPNGSDIFFHQSNLSKGYTPKTSDQVKFDIGEGKKGPVAENVCLAD